MPGDILLTSWHENNRLDGQLLSQDLVLFATMDLLARVHAIREVPPQVAPPQPLPERLENGWNALRRLDANNIAGPFQRESLGRRMAWLQEQIDNVQIEQRLCHFDTLPRNFLLAKPAVAAASQETLLPLRPLLCDWDWLRWGDPMRDIGKLLTLGDVAMEKTPALLARYFGRPPRPAELRHLLVVMDAIALDYMASNAVSLHTHQHPAVWYLAKRLCTSEALMAGAPQLVWAPELATTKPAT